VTAGEVKVLVEKYAWHMETRVLLHVNGCESDPGEENLNPSTSGVQSMMKLAIKESFSDETRYSVK
jgi:hypothetical protein